MEPNSTQPPKTAHRRLFVPILCAQAEMGEGFLRSLLDPAAAGATSGAVVYDRYSAFVEVMASDPEKDAGWVERVRLADAVALLIHYLDAASMQEVRVRLQKLNSLGRRIPVGVLIVREPNEHEFKLNCTDCGQKLWIRETDIGRRGRCTNCRKPMVVPTPSEYLHNQLPLPDSVPVLNVVRGESALCRGVLANLLARVAYGSMETHPGTTATADFLKQATVPINL